MSNENISNNFKIVFDANSSGSYDDNEQTTQPQLQLQPQPQPQQSQSSQQQQQLVIRETDQVKQDISRSFRGVNWDDVSTNLLLDIYKSKFPLLESTPHNKGRKQIYEEMRAEFNSSEHIENKRTLKSLTRKWGEMLAKYRIRRGTEMRTGKLPDTPWKYHERMHEIVGHLPPNGRLSFPMANATIESSSFISEKMNNACASSSSSSWASTNTAAETCAKDENTTFSNINNKRVRTEDNDEYNNESADTSESTTIQTQITDGTPPTSSTGSQVRPIQPKTSVQGAPPNQSQQVNSPATKVPRRIEPKRNLTSSNNSNNDNSNEKGKGRSQKRKDTTFIFKPTSIHEQSHPQNGVFMEASSLQADNHDLRNTLEQILETGRKAAEPATLTGQTVSESLRIIAEASRQMAESNRLLAQQIENNSKTTEILLEGMKNLIESINKKDGNHGDSGTNNDNSE